VLVTTFASNNGRLREVVRSAHKLGRITAVVGRSMEENLKVARELGFMNVPDGSIVDVRETSDMAPERVVLLSTGSQGEPTSVLSRMARGDHPLVRIQAGDTVIFSASPVPGNSRSRAPSITLPTRRAGGLSDDRSTHSRERPRQSRGTEAPAATGPAALPDPGAR
jgi:ribonuclease J